MAARRLALDEGLAGPALADFHVRAGAGQAESTIDLPVPRHRHDRGRLVVEPDARQGVALLRRRPQDKLHLEQARMGAGGRGRHRRILLHRQTGPGSTGHAQDEDEQHALHGAPSWGSDGLGHIVRSPVVTAMATSPRPRNPGMRSRRNGHRHRYIPAALAALFALILPHAARADDNPGYDRPGLGFTPAVLGTGDVTWEQGLPDWSRCRDAGVASAQYTTDGLLRVGLKFALPATGAFSWGLLGSVEFTDGARAFRNPQRQYLLGADFNWQWNAR